MTKDVLVKRYYSDHGDPIKSKWWAAPTAEMHRHVFGVVKGIREKQSYRTLNNLRWAKLYTNADILGLQAGLFARVADPNTYLTNRISLNVIAACIDTVSSKIAKDKTRPLFLTNDGDWTMQRKAELLTSYMEGAFDTMGCGTGDMRTLYGLGRRTFVDAAVFGTGVVKFFADHDSGQVKAERCLIEEIIVDEAEASYEDPRQMHQEKLAHREVIIDLYPDFREQILAAPCGLEGTAMHHASSADMIKIVESWHLPSAPGSDDGVHCITVQGATLFSETYTKSYFPFLWKRWKPRLLGFYGSGIPEELVGIQLEINKILRTVAIAQHLMCSPQVWLEMGSKIAKNQIDNEIGGVKYYQGAAPIFMTPSGMAPEVYSHMENLYNKAFQVVGVSQLSATSAKPSGLNAAVALREYQDIESERFALVQQRDQDFYIEAAYMVMDLMDELDSPKFMVSNTSGTREISWKECRIARDRLKIRAYPTDILPSQPAGKLQKVQELLQAGFFETKEEALELLDFPDLARSTTLKISSRVNIRRMLEKIVDEGSYEPPEPYTNLPLAKSLAQAYYEKGKCDGMPEDRLELLRRWMDDVQHLADQAQAALAPPQPMAPVAQPAPQPVSDLMPVAN